MQLAGSKYGEARSLQESFQFYLPSELVFHQADPEGI